MFFGQLWLESTRFPKESLINWLVAFCRQRTIANSEGYKVGDDTNSIICAAYKTEIHHHDFHARLLVSLVKLVLL